MAKFHALHMMMGRPEQLRDSEGIENKVSRAVYLLCRTEEVRANNCHYQEISTRKENYTSHDQFKGPFTDPLRFEILVGKLDGGVSTSIIFQ